MKQTVINVTTDANKSKRPSLLWLPDDYGTTKTNYPLLVFMHGAGECGTDLSKIYGNSNAGGPAYFIEQGKFPSSFVNPVDKQAYKFIVLSPQATSWSTTSQELDFVLQYMAANYRVDTTRIYLTGLSAGGQGVTTYVGGMDTNGKAITKSFNIAAVIPMSAVFNAATSQSIAQRIVNDKVQIWAFGATDGTDTWGDQTIGLVTWYINKISTPVKPGMIVKMPYGVVSAYAGGHGGWGNFYDPSFKQGGMSIYEWALQYTSGVAATIPVIDPPASTPLPVIKTIKSIIINYTDGSSEVRP